MKSAQVEEYGQEVKVKEDGGVPHPGPHEVQIHVQMCGLCHTDVHAINGDWPKKAKMPLVLGHEGAGVVSEVGSEVTEYKVGDHVGVPWLYYACGSCEYCISGWETLCGKQMNCGYSIDGCMRQFTVAPAAYVVPIPPELEFEQVAPILCAGVTVYKALKESEARPGQFVLIIGAAGGLGHLAVQYARAMGYRVIGADVGDEKMDYLRSLGVELAVDVMKHDLSPVQQIKDFTIGGAHAVIVISAHPSSYSLGLNCCRRKGFVVCVSMPRDEINLNVTQIILNRITLRGSIVGTREDMREAIDFAARGLVRCHVTCRPLEEVNEAIKDMLANRIIGRVVFPL
jgi:propanol-preferring alcohol dehydrogenase